MARARARTVIDRTLTSPGRIIDPLPMKQFNPGSPGMQNLAPFAWIRGQLRKRQRNWQTSRDRVKLEQKLKDFNPKLFEEEIAPDLFRDFYANYASANLPALREICTEPFYRAVRSGIEESNAQYNELRAMDVLNYLEPIKILQVRLAYGSSSIQKMPNEEPTHAQITTRIVSRQLPVTNSLYNAPTNKSNTKNLHSPNARKGGADIGTWVAAVDSTTGYQFYYNTKTKAALWDPPAQLGAVGAQPVLMESTGYAREEIPDDTTVDGVAFYRVYNAVTWERPLRANSKWQICEV